VSDVRTQTGVLLYAVLKVIDAVVEELIVTTPAMSLLELFVWICPPAEFTVTEGAATPTLLVRVVAAELAARVRLPLDDPLNVTCPAEPLAAPKVSCPTAVGLPEVSTLNAEVPPTSRLMSVEPEAEWVFVILLRMLVNVVVLLFQVAV
jgi:hypothetical protein